MSSWMILRKVAALSLVTGINMLSRSSSQSLHCLVPVPNGSLYGFHKENEFVVTLFECVMNCHSQQVLSSSQVVFITLLHCFFHCWWNAFGRAGPNMDQSFLLSVKTSRLASESNKQRFGLLCFFFFVCLNFCFFKRLFFPPVVTCHGICRLKWHCREVQLGMRVRVGGVSHCSRYEFWFCQKFSCHRVQV